MDSADIKDMYVGAGGRDMVPFLEVLNGMLKRGVEVRLIHAKEPEKLATCYRNYLALAAENGCKSIAFLCRI